MIPTDAYSDAGYSSWFTAQKKQSDRFVSGNAANFVDMPVFSIVVPLFDTPLSYLKDMSDSVLNQTYQNLELILVNASPDKAELCVELASLAAQDERVKIVTLLENLGITQNTYAGIAVAEGDFVCFLDHDDFLEPDALFHYAQAINENQSIDLIYCDEDMIDEQGVFVRPLFKPNYSPDLLLSKNYVIHFLAIRKTLLDELEQPSSELDGAQDYHLTLCAAESARAIHHVPKVLYHWRISPESTAVKAKAKPYAEEAGRKALELHLQRTGQAGEVSLGAIPNIYQTKLAVKEEPLVTILIETVNPKPCASFLSDLRDKLNYPKVEIIPVAGSLATRLQRLNQAVRESAGEYLLFLNDSLKLPQDGFLTSLLALCQREHAGAVAPITLYSNNTIKHSGFALPPQGILPLWHGVPDSYPGYLCQLTCLQNLSALPLTGMLLKRSAYNTAGGFNERFQSLVGDIEFCARLTQAGYSLTQVPSVKIILPEKCPEPRYTSTLNPKDFNPTEIELFKQSNLKLWNSPDPYFNINLNQTSAYYQLPD